ncbi:hypothetical protein NXW76_20670 [Bacteroides thetaiotaomicron]|nr:hypothetical protein [Bacteroides thetaiotaomicron]
MDEAVFIAQYTFLATPAVIEEESRILGKIARRLRCEYVIRFEDDGKFYFLLETRSGYEEHFARCGWYIVSQTDFNSRLTIGMGLYESGNLAGFMYRLDSGSEDEARFWNNILVFTFFNDFRKAFFPLDNRFQGFFRLDGPCVYTFMTIAPSAGTTRLLSKGRRCRTPSGVSRAVSRPTSSSSSSPSPPAASGRFRRTGTVPYWFPSRHPHGRSTAPGTRRSAASSRRTWGLPTGTGR